LTGSIGAGKSTVAGILESLGAAVIDADRLSHEALQSPEVVERVLDERGGVDRQSVGRVVFEDPQELERLQDVLYPRIARRREALMAQHQSDRSVRAIILDTPKLYEVGMERMCDAVILVDAAPDVRLKRLQQNRGWTDDELARREKLLDPLDRKRAKADYIIENNSSVEALRIEIERVLAAALASFSQMHTK